MISIGIPFFNPGKYFLPAINSILKQTYKDFELILIDDGSTDDSLSLARSIKDSRVRVISDGFNLGLPARLNQIIKLATGDFIARMDADDLCSLTRLQKQLDILLLDNNLDAVFTGCCSIDNNCKIIGVSGKESNLQIELKQLLKGNTGILHASMLARREWCLRNLYNEKNIGSEDYELWLRAKLKNDFKIKTLSDPLYFYRIESNASFFKMKRGYLSQIEVLNQLSKEYSNDLFFDYISKYKIKIKIITILNLMGLMKILFIRRGSAKNSDIVNKLALEITRDLI